MGIEPLSCNSSMLVFFGTSVIPFFLDLSMNSKGLWAILKLILRTLVIHIPQVPFSSPMMLIFGGKGYEHVKVRLPGIWPLASLVTDVVFQHLRIDIM